ncbi:MAG: hypothetical protein ACR2J8_07505, partial [Thermomicrobiales bacterium]
MDHTAFDRIARLLGAASTRRAGLTAALGALAASATAAAKSPHHPKPEGPCGDHSRKDNTCSKDSQCCTGFCKKGLKNTDGQGRCRCIKKGQPCTPSQTCCGNLACVDGICGSNCTVCSTGCPFDSVNDAYAAASPGDTILIGRGTWPTGISVTKDITLAACSAKPATLIPDRVQVSPDTNDTYYVILTEDAIDTSPYAVTVRGLNLRGSGKHRKEILLNSYPTGNVAFTVQSATLTNAHGSFYVAAGDHLLEDSTITDCSYG